MEKIEKEQEAISWFKKWSDKKIFNGKNIKEFLAYGDISFWWFFDFYMYNHMINGIQGKRKGDASSFKRALASWYIFYRTLARKIYGHIFMNITGQDKGNTALVISHRVNWRSSGKGRNTKQDTLFNGIIKKLREKGIRVIAIDRNFVTGTRILNEKRKFDSRLWRPVEVYIKFSDIIRAFNLNRKINGIYKRNRDNSEYKKSFIMNGEDMLPLMKETIDLAFSYIPMEAYIQIKAIENSIEREDVKLIILSHEYGTQGKAPIIAGKKRNVPTIVLQHGVIHPYHMGYCHTPNEIGDWSPMHCPIPDRIVVYGKYTRDILERVGHYPPESIVIAGQPKYDVLSDPGKIYDPEKFFERNGIKPKKINVLVATQPFPIQQHRNIFLRNILRLTEFPEIQLIVKPHPGEDSAWHKKIIDEAGVYVPIIDPKSDIFEAIFATDIMATCSSTTATEAIIMDKDILIVNLTGQSDPIPYVESGAAVGVYKENDLLPVVKKLLEDDELKIKISKNRKKFLEYHLYTIDGQSTQRFVDLVNSMMGQAYIKTYWTKNKYGSSNH